MVQSVLSCYDLGEKKFNVSEFGTGLINNTWKVTSDDGIEQYLLQRINNKIFKRPESIAHNIRLIADYLKKKHPDYLFIAPILTKDHNDLVHDKNLGYFRLFPFLKNAHSIDVVTSPDQAYEASRQFALFTKLLSGFDISTLQTTLEDFHNLTLRYQQFKEAVNHGNIERIKESMNLILFLEDQYSIVDTFEKIKHNPGFKLRVTHHDTKISNVLFDSNDKSICVIDLDTTMPGYFFSDVGDMMRTYLSPVSEEDTDLDKIEIRDEYFEAIAKGYLSTMGKELSEMERNHFVYSGKFMVYMQALRFLTDYLNNDIYYATHYEGQNLNRAKNQITLLERILEKESTYQAMVSELLPDLVS